MKNNNSFYQNNWFYTLYLWGFLIILALPLLNWPIYFSPPNWAKTLVFQIVFSIMLFIFLYHILWQRNEHIFNRVWPVRKENIAFWLLLGLFIVQLISTIFSVDFHYSFFGSPYRGGGFVNYGFYILFAALAFLALKENDWQKLWSFSIFIGVIVCILAIVSRFGLFSDVIISRVDNISSTIGGPNTLGLYLMLLVFPALNLGLLAKKLAKRIFYLVAFLLFCFLILLTISQGAYLGLGAGAVYFLLLYPTKNLSQPTARKMLYAKIAFVALVIIIAATALFIKSNPDIGINQNYLFKQLTTWKIDQSRLSTWQIALKASLDRPLLGYGPENFSIGFDRHYDPSLPLLEMEPGTPASWWDKAHNFALNLLVETGIVGLAVFLALFGWIFWRLHRISHIKTDESQNPIKKDPFIAHGIQATLIAYFTNLMFNFENFASYILAFLIVGYALYLTMPQQTPTSGQHTSHNFLFKYRKPIAGIAFVLLICFLWFFAVKPFNVNVRINTALYLARSKQCNQAINLMNREMKKHSIIDGYLRIKYVDIIITCIQAYPQNDVAYVKQIVPALQENVKIMPYYTRNWLWMVAFNNMVAVAETDPEKKKAILDQNREYLKKVEALSPRRHEILVETINFEIYAQNYEKARQLGEDCAQKYPDFNACYWYLGLSQIYLSKNNAELQEGKRNMEKAQNMGYSQLSQYSLTQLAFLYLSKNNYKELEWVYERLTQHNPHNPRYFAGLALIYKRNGKIEQSKNAVKGILRIQSDARSIEHGWTETEKTIVLLLENILGVKESNPAYHAALHDLYSEMAREEKDPVKSKLYQQRADEEKMKAGNQ